MRDPISFKVAGDGPALLLVHGDFNDGPTAWSRQMVSLVDKHRMIVVDRRGNGASPREPRPYTIAGDAADVLAAANAAGAEEFHLAGHSYGGLVAIEIARQAPDRVRSLHLIEPPYLALLPDNAEVASLIAAGSEIQRRSVEWGPDRTAGEFFTVIAGEAGLAKLKASPGWALVVNEAGRLADAEYPGDYPPAALDDLRLDVPVRVYTGGRSHPALQAVARRLAELIPGSELIVVPNATHAVQYAGDPFDQALLAVTLA